MKNTKMIIGQIVSIWRNNTINMKVTKEQVIRIKKLKKKGLMQKEISKILNLKESTVSYYYSEGRKDKAIKYQKEYQKKNPPKRTDRLREYQRKYHKERYWRLKKTI